ncbi:MAG: hypothetical protein IKI64_08970 [Clostridia bacterium]|nr:hypothetical protein [Clostridia bacterium]
MKKKLGSRRIRRVRRVKIKRRPVRRARRVSARPARKSPRSRPRRVKSPSSRRRIRLEAADIPLLFCLFALLGGIALLLYLHFAKGLVF